MRHRTGSSGVAAAREAAAAKRARSYRESLTNGGFYETTCAGNAAGAHLRPSRSSHDKNAGLAAGLAQLKAGLAPFVLEFAVSGLPG